MDVGGGVSRLLRGDAAFEGRAEGAKVAKVAAYQSLWAVRHVEITQE